MKIRQSAYLTSVKITQKYDEYNTLRSVETTENFSDVKNVCYINYP